MAKSRQKKRRDLKAVIKTLDVSSLHDSDLTDVLLHTASTLNFRKAIANTDASLAQSSANYCYTKSGSSSTVSIWSGGFKVGESSQADAEARGIRPCG
jgi:hypothetical protein